MELQDYIAISGVSGLHKMVGNRKNGLIVEQLSSGKRRFVSMRKHQFSPLESISIYTLEDTVPLRDVFAKMLEMKPEVPLVEPKAESYVLFEYFEQILPSFDEDKVKAGDIKKILQWFSELEELDLLKAKGSQEEE